jgi:hypothetical protein
MNRPLVACTLAALLLQGCSIVFPLHSVLNHRSAYGLVEHTADVTVPLVCPGTVDHFTVTFAACCTAGSIAARLVAPDGSIAWRQSVRNGQCDEQIALPAATGDWRCELELVEYCGDYRIGLHAFGDECVRVELMLAEK